MTEEQKEIILETMEIAVNIWNDKDLTDEERKELLDGVLSDERNT